MKNKKVLSKILSIILALAMAAAWLPIGGAYAATGDSTPPETPTNNDFRLDDPNDEEFVLDEVLAAADSLEQAQTIAEAYGLQLKSYAYGIAVLGAPDPELIVAQSAKTRGGPKLGLNRIYQIDEAPEPVETFRPEKEYAPHITDDENNTHRHDDNYSPHITDDENNTLKHNDNYSPHITNDENTHRHDDTYSPHIADDENNTHRHDGNFSPHITDDENTYRHDDTYQAPDRNERSKVYKYNDTLKMHKSDDDYNAYKHDGIIEQPERDDKLKAPYQLSEVTDNKYQENVNKKEEPGRLHINEPESNRKEKLDKSIRDEIGEPNGSDKSEYQIQWHRTEMDIDRAHDISLGKNVVIAVIDTGIDIDHPAFAGRISEKSYNSHTDQLGLEYVRDDYGHGTHVSGIAAASFDNEADVCGVAPGAEILTIKANNPEDTHYFLTVSWLRGLNYAVENGAQVVNMSFGRHYIGGWDELEHAVIANAVAKGVTLVCAAGNDSYYHARFPAAYPECIAVSATRQGYMFDSGYSNYGPEIAVSAPGSNIYSTYIGGGYGLMSGTSMASPNAAGVAALIIALHPTYTPQQVRDVLCETAQDAGEIGRDDYYGAGIVNAYAAVLGPDALYSVVYDYNDGDRMPVTVRVVPNGKLLTRNLPELDGYIFDGWYINGTGEEFNFKSAIVSDLKLYAKWVKIEPGMYCLEFPDTNFRRAVLQMLEDKYDEYRKDSSFVENDKDLLASVEQLYIYNMSIYDLTGLQYFSGLKYFDCGYNYLTQLCVSKNPELQVLYVSHNQLNSLNVSHNVALEQLSCWNNRLTELDVTKNTQLRRLDCDGNMLSGIDVSKNEELVSLDCRNNRLLELDVTKNTELIELYCHNNLLDNLDVSNNLSLSWLYCNRNYMATTDSVYGWQDIGLVLYDSFYFYPQMTGAKPTGIDITESFKDPGFLNAVRDLAGKSAGPILDYDVAWIDELYLNYWYSGYIINDLSGIENFKSLKYLECANQQLTKLDLSKNTTLESVYCENNRLDAVNVSGSPVLRNLYLDNNRLTSLDVSNNARLLVLNVNDCNLTELDLSSNIELENLWCARNQLANLDISNCAGLRRINCSRNQLKVLDVTGCSNLWYLHCYDNFLIEIDIAGYSELWSLYCDNNQLTSLDVTGCSELYYFDCSNNLLTSLDVTDCNELRDLYCYDNRLTQIDATGLSLEYFDCSYNYMNGPSDVKGFPVEKWDEIYYIFEPQYTNAIDITEYFTDLNFRAEVYNEIGKSSGGRIYDINVARISWLSVYNRGIKSLAGLEWFTNLQELQCSNNQITTIPKLPASLKYLYCWSNQIAKLPELPSGLIDLDCESNQLTSLDVAGCSELWGLNCDNNKLTSLDVTGCSELRYLYCYNNQLTLLDVTGCSELRYLYCYNNQLTSLDVTGCSELRYLYCNNNQLTSLDVTGCSELRYLYCNNNQLTSLNVAGCSELRYLYCYNNQLTSLDVTGCGNLWNLDCSNNQLTSLDVTSCGNLWSLYCYDNLLTEINATGLSLGYFDCSLNYMNEPSDVKGFPVDMWDDKDYIFEPQYTNAIDITGYFTDQNFRAAVYDAIGKSTSERIYNFDVARIKWLDMFDRGITSLAGIEWFYRLQELYCPYNQITTVPKLPDSLIYLYCWSNRITELPELPSGLIELSCDSNQLTALDLTGCGELRYLYCYNNQLATLDVADCGNLIDLYCYYNQLTTLDVTGCRNLWNLDCSNNQLTSLDVTGYGNLWYFLCYNNQLTTLYVTGCWNLWYFYCYNNQLTTLDVTGCRNLWNLDCSNNQLTTLDVTGCGNLWRLYCYDNLLTGIDVTGLSLGYFDCSLNYMNKPSDVKGFPVDMWNDKDYVFEPQYTNAIDITGYFTDPNFRAAVYDAIGKSTGKSIYNFDVARIKWLNVNNRGIKSLAGLEWFTRLQELQCSNNQIATVPKLPDSLMYLYCRSNQISELPELPSGLVVLDCDSNQLTALPELPVGLNYLYCYNNQITTIPELPDSLMYLYCWSNKITELQELPSGLIQLDCESNQLTALSELPVGLNYLDCSYNLLTSLYVTGCGSLEYLYCGNNQLTTFDVTGCGRLRYLYCGNNQLTSLDVTGCGNLWSLNCYNNQLTSLDVTGCRDLWELYCHYNRLTGIDVTGLSLRYFDCSYNYMKDTSDVKGFHGKWDGIYYIFNQQHKTFTITATAGANGSISPSGDISVLEGGSQSFTITPESGYKIKSVIVDDEDKGAITSYTFTDVTSNRTINATFVRIEEPHIIKAEAGAGGSISPNGDTPVPEGGSQSFTITPDDGYKIKSVIVDGEDKGAITFYTFTDVTDKHTITAAFVRIEEPHIIIDYIIKAEAGAGGSISPSSDIQVHEGGSQSFTITPDDGYKIESVIVDGEDKGAITSYTFTDVTSNRTINAKFVRIEEPHIIIEYIIKAEAGVGGSISPSGDISVPEGGSQSFTITRADGYNIESVIVDNENKGAITSYTFTDVTGKHTITVTFSAISKGSGGPGGSGGSNLPADNTAPEVEPTDPEPPLAEVVSYDDVALTDWYYSAVAYTSGKGLMTGTGDNKFSPNIPMSRAMLVTVLYRLENEPEINSQSMSSKSQFRDIVEGAWYYNAVIWAAENGIVEGYGNGVFGLNDPVTREQTVAILYRYTKTKGFNVSVADDLAEFVDADAVSIWAVEALQWAVAEGIIQGLPGNLIAPQLTSTRAQIATIFMRYIEGFLGKYAAPEE